MTAIASTLRQTFAAARQRISDGMEHPGLFQAYDWTPGPTYGRRRAQTFGERRASYASVIESVRRIEDGKRYNRLRSIIVAESPECLNLLRRLHALDDLPFGMRKSDYAAPLQAEFETIIAGRMAERHTGQAA